MLKIHIFGKSQGCSKCDALKRKVANVLKEDAHFREVFGVVLHDLLTEEGIADFCETNINPNCVPGLVIGDDAGFLQSRCTSDEWLADGALLRPWLGLVTDYGERHRGVISSEEIRGLLADALEIAGKD
jgi:hypothetical protein